MCLSQLFATEPSAVWVDEGLGVIIAGIVDQIGLVEEIDRHIEQHPQQLISTGQVVKAMILNGLGFVSSPLYLFKEFFVGKVTEHLLGEGILPEKLNDDRIERALDSLWNYGLTPMFTNIDRYFDFFNS